MTDRTCIVCDATMSGIASKRYCSSRCKYQGRDRKLCAGCGRKLGWAANDPRAVHDKCADCRWECGTVQRYRRGCRCAECRSAIAQAAKVYNDQVKAKTGQSPTQKYKPAKATGVRCADCDAPLAILRKHRRCADCIPAFMARRKRTANHRRNARAKLARAAQGTRGSSRWVFFGGPCAECGDNFMRRGTPTKFCSPRCREKSKSKWISTGDRLAIYERDGWICQLCHDPVNPDLHYLDNMAPSLDHIICRSWTSVPDHSPSNLRLAHRLCNSIRGDERHEQPAPRRMSPRE